MKLHTPFFPRFLMIIFVTNNTSTSNRLLQEIASNATDIRNRGSDYCGIEETDMSLASQINA